LVLVTLAVLLPVSAVRADPLTIAALGDSLTDTYVGKSYSGTNLNWVDQLRALRSDGVTITDLAHAGDTGADLLARGQHTDAIRLASQGSARYATLYVGANDIGAFVEGVSRGGTLDPTATITRLVGNVGSALAALQAGGLKVVLANVPDIT